jgi:DNA gyrase subunit A
VLLDVIRTELRNLQEEFGDARRTEIRAGEEDLDILDLIESEDVVGHALARRLRQAPADHGLSRAEARRQGPFRPTAVKEEDFIEPAVGGQHARHAAHLHQRRPRVLAQGLPAAGRRPEFARPSDRQLDSAEEGEKVQAVLPVP